MLTINAFGSNSNAFLATSRSSLIVALLLFASGVFHASFAGHDQQILHAKPGKPGPSSKATEGWQPVYHEHEFKRSAHLRAKPDSLIVVDLEAAGKGRRPIDDSGRRGVDKIPLEFADAGQREICWDGGALFDAPVGSAPHEFVLRDWRQREVARVTEGGACASAHIGPGRYTAFFHAGAARGPASSKVFVRPAQMFAGGDGPPAVVDPETGPGDPDAEAACAVKTVSAILSDDAPGFRDTLQPGEIALYFDPLDREPPFYIWVVILNGPCTALDTIANMLNLHQIKEPLGVVYTATLFPSQSRNVALYYSGEDFIGPRVQVPELCACEKSGCSDCKSISNRARFTDPLHDFFNCARLIQDGLECSLSEIRLRASLTVLTSSLDPGTPVDQLLISTNRCENCDFRGSSALRGQSLANAFVRGSDFSHADLSGTTLDRANAENAIFDSLITNQASAQGPARPVSFSGASLAGARFAYERTLIPQTQEIAFHPAARLVGADFSGSDLSGAAFPRAVLSALLPAPPGTDHCEPPDTSACELLGEETCAADLDDAVGAELDLRRAKMTGASLRGADLSDAWLHRIEAYAADFSAVGKNPVTALDGAAFLRSDLRCATFEQASGSDVDFTEAQMRFSLLRNAVLPRAILSGAQLNPANLGSADLRDANLAADIDRGVDRANLERSYMKGTNLDGANMTGAHLNFVSWYSSTCSDDGGCTARAQKATLVATELRCARLPHIDFSGATMQGAILSSAALSGARLLNAGNLVNLGPTNSGNRSQLNNTDLRAADLSGADLTGADLENALVLALAEQAPAAGTFHVWAAADPGRYPAPLVVPDGDACGLASTSANFDAWVAQQTCLNVSANSTQTPAVTSEGTTCPNGMQRSEGCGDITPTSKTWVLDPPPTLPIADCTPS